MNYINLFRKLAYKDKDINYFRGLPGEEGKLFKEMYSWLNTNHYYKSGEEKKERIKCIFNRIRANYLGIVCQDIYEKDGATMYETEKFHEDILTAVYLQAVKDPTKYEEFDSVIRLIKEYHDVDYDIFDIPAHLLSILKNGVDEESRFKSSFTPEICHEGWGVNRPNSCAPARWKYWEDIFDIKKLFFGGGLHCEELDFVIGLFPTKKGKLNACGVLEMATKEGLKKYHA